MKRLLFLALIILILIYCEKKERLSFESQAYRAYSVPDLIVKHDFIYDVRAYGAEADDSADDTDYIQAAIDSASSQGGGIVYFPPGTYNIDTLINMKTGVGLQGAGRKYTIIQCDSNYDAIHFGDRGTTAMGKDCFIRDLQLDGNDIANHGLVFRGASTSSDYYAIFNDISDVTIANFDSFGIYLDSWCFSNSFTRVYMLNNYHGAYLDSSANNVSFRECDINGSDSTGIQVQASYECTGVFIGDNCQFDGNDRAIMATGDCRFIIIKNNYFENNTDTTIVWRPTSAYRSTMIIDGNYIIGNNDASSCAITCTTSTIITNNHITQGATYTYDDCGIFVDTLSTDIFIWGNYYNSGSGDELNWENKVSSPYKIWDDGGDIYEGNYGSLILNETAGNFKIIEFQKDDTTRWNVRTQTDANGSDFEIKRYDSNGDLTDTPFTLDWATGNLTIDDTLIGYGSNNLIVKDTTEFDYKVDIQDSVRLGSGGVWIRKMFLSAGAESLGVTYYNTTLTRLDTVWLTQ